MTEAHINLNYFNPEGIGCKSSLLKWVIGYPTCKSIPSTLICVTVDLNQLECFNTNKIILIFLSDDSVNSKRRLIPSCLFLLFGDYKLKTFGCDIKTLNHCIEILFGTKIYWTVGLNNLLLFRYIDKKAKKHFELFL